MIVVTGGAGFVGSNIIKELNNRGVTNIVVVDDMTDGSKFRNLVTCKVADYIDAAAFRESIRTKTFHHRPRVIFHYGAISSITETNGKKMLDANFTYSKELFQWCKNQGVRFIYASSAAVYGNKTTFIEGNAQEAPLNVYGYSKLLFDEYVIKNSDARSPQCAGLRLFNVYGPGEQHRDAVPSTVYQFYEKRKSYKAIELFGEYAGVEAGQQKRDFVHVEDVARLNCWFLDHPEVSGIYNVGTGIASSFHDVAMEVAKHFGNPEGYIKFVPFPAELKGRYQSFTCADISKLRRAGSVLRFRSIKEGIKDYMEWLENNEGLDR
ncbi:NAD-dependent epimerase/dehydratase [Penicillium coprophilum]|uniref:NAD-dependent epimerase/dehydratase n=1 Tax=Penicillium coprophilum TaxID=36646 RepID=UPI00238BD543|nr:NAD-dependent epimerase/dehydratase [Penicillium coprophilum]KAJ5154975.1 NAD-dependent epimerase/dehydratase [Penicillium coprophilum]